MKRISRRKFLKEAGSLVIGFSLVRHLSPKVLFAQEGLPGSLADYPELDAWLRIDSRGTVTVFTGKVELGQGILTALVQIVAEELDVPLEKIGIISGDTERTPDEGTTTGSRSIERSGMALRGAAAEARDVLLELAASRLRMAADRLEVSDGVIHPKGSAEPQVGYGELLGGRRFLRRASGKAAPKKPEEHHLVGTPVSRLDIPAKVTGRPHYVQDLRLEGMLHGRVLHPPMYGAKLEKIDLETVRRMPGVVQVVQDGSFVGVIAEREDQADNSLKRLRETANWRPGSDLPAGADFFSHFRQLPSQDLEVRQEGDVESAFEGAFQKVQATFTKPYQAHAAMGPSCAVAEFRGGRLTIWTHSQGVFSFRAELSKLLGIAQKNVRAIHREGAGCYGHNGADDAAADAALLARARPGAPVRVQWMRDDEFLWEPYGSAMLAELRAGLDERGNAVAWDYHVFSDRHGARPGDRGALVAGWHLARPVPLRDRGSPRGAYRNAEPLYRFPNCKVVAHIVEGPLRVSALRSLGAYGNVFALESFMDELAAAAAADPVEFRLRHLEDPRAREVIRTAARMAAWKSGKRPTGQGTGIAFAQYKNTAAYVAVVAEAVVDRDSGKIRVRRAVAAVDAGQVINPDGLKNQIEGGIIQATSWTLKEEVLFSAGGIQSKDWTSYPILTFPEVPDVEVAVIEGSKETPVGAGEAAQGPAGAAIANAVFDAAGIRLRDIPFKPGRVQAAVRSQKRGAEVG